MKIIKAKLIFRENKYIYKNTVKFCLFELFEE